MFPIWGPPLNWFYYGLSHITVISLGFQALSLLALVWPYCICSLRVLGFPSPVLGAHLALKVTPPCGVGPLLLLPLIPVPAQVLIYALYWAGRGYQPNLFLGPVRPHIYNRVGVSQPTVGLSAVYGCYETLISLSISICFCSYFSFAISSSKVRFSLKNRS